MATSPNDPRILAAINKAMAWQRSMVGKATGNSVWSIAYPEWVGSGYAWCGGFQVAAFRQAGVDLLKCCWWFYTPYIKNFAVRIGAWKTTGHSYGDNCLFDWSLNGEIDHVGASWPDPSSASYRSVEGNTSSGNAGSQSNGGGCWMRYRTRPQLRGWADMRKVLAWMIDNGKWDGKITVASATPTVTGKAKTKTDGQDALDVDGSQGPATIARWQQVMGTPIDGTISTPSECIKAFQRFLNTAVTEEWISKLTGKKQLDIDGQAGSKTWRVFQFWVANTWPAQMKLVCGFTRDSDNKRFWSEWVDGNPGPWTTKMLQYALNKSYKDSGKLGAKK